ncbi:hypothetical protein EUX98_g356 [Antrodiella citrinella]|uniref:Uncharacterized protein n=1 Tax=Antrodiella citrinella TaxID=2447956 RepID=A0A4S4N487_9APHY|nr:hypothetical protein EUX98_g356 [Antrodiella citrinella]
MKQFPLDKTFIVSLWLEAMFFMGIVFFCIATMHLGMNCFRMIRGYVEHVNDPGGAVGYLGNLAPWDHVFKDTLYATQEILGDGVAIYRCWVIWNRDWRIVILPLMLFIVSIISGYTVCGLYTSQVAGSTVFAPRLTHWISTFYAVAVVQSAMTTGLMAFRIWKTDQRSSSFRANESNLMPVLRILVESAALQLIVETLLLSLYASDYNPQYILLEIVTPLVGITFTAITIRLTLRMSGALDPSKASLGLTHSSNLNTSHAQIATIGSMPMRPIAINITKDVHHHHAAAAGAYYPPHHHRKTASVPVSMGGEGDVFYEEMHGRGGALGGDEKLNVDDDRLSLVYTTSSSAVSSEKKIRPSSELEGTVERPRNALDAYHAV